MGVSISGGTYSFLVRTQGGPVAFDWYVFTMPTHIAPSTTGMKVWRPSDGRLVFDTGMKWMRVAGQIIGGARGGQLDPSRSYAIAFADASVSQSRQWINNPETQPAQVDQYTYIPGARVLNGVF